jgi:hypothetical protein
MYLDIGKSKTLTRRYDCGHIGGGQVDQELSLEG